MKKGFAEILKALLLYYLVVLIIQTFAFAYYGFKASGYGLTGDGAALYVKTQYNYYSPVFGCVIALIAVLIFIKLKKPGFVGNKGGFLYIYSILCGIGISMGLNGLMHICGLIDIENVGQVSRSSWLLVFYILYVAFLAPICEEYLFRGIIYANVYDAMRSFPVASFVSAVMFGLFHMNLLQGIYGFVFAFLLCLVYYRTGDLRYSILIHVAANSFSLIINMSKNLRMGLVRGIVFYVCLGIGLCIFGVVMMIRCFENKKENLG